MPGRLSAPAAVRNRQPILDVLQRHVSVPGTLLEIASGTGEHAVWFATHLSGLTVQPSDPDPRHRDSIEAWRGEYDGPNLHAALDLDVTAPDWWRDPDLPSPVSSLVCINMIHISPWEATLGLFRGASALLEAGAPLILYGPYRRDGQHTAPSNLAFDTSLRSRDPRFGVRDLEAVRDAAELEGFALDEIVQMPANNLSIVLRKSRGVSATD